jgi:hypothetical protein
MDCQMSRITLSRQESEIVLSVSAHDGQQATFRLTDQDATKLVAALLPIVWAAVEDTPIFEMIPAMSSFNPRIEVDRADSGEIIIGYADASRRPLLIHLARDSAKGLRDILSRALSFDS